MSKKNCQFKKDDRVVDVGIDDEGFPRGTPAVLISINKATVFIAYENSQGLCRIMPRIDFINRFVKVTELPPTPEDQLDLFKAKEEIYD